MSRNSIIGIIVAVIILGGGAALFAANHNSGSDNQTNSTSSTNQTDQSMNGMATNNTTTPSTKTPSAETPATTSSVVIENFAFSPANITVKKGTTVSWTNKDSATHTVTENDSQTGPDSGNLATGKSYSFTYSTVGAFKYHCAIHPNMVGTVTVTE